MDVQASLNAVVQYNQFITKQLKAQYEIPNEFMELLSSFVSWDLGLRPHGNEHTKQLWYMAKELSLKISDQSKRLRLII